MFDQNGFYTPYMGQTQQRMPQFVVRQVGNIEEAKSCLIDPLNVWLFVDMTAGRIYMKRMGSNGTSLFDIFVAEQNVERKPDPLESVERRLTALENALGVGKEGANVQSVRTDS